MAITHRLTVPCELCAQADSRLQNVRKRKGRAIPHAQRNAADDDGDSSDEDEDSQDEQKEAPASKQAKKTANSTPSAAPQAAGSAASSHASAAASSSATPAAASSDDDASDSDDDAPEVVSTTRAADTAPSAATDGTIEANADSLTVAATLAAAAAAARQKKKNKKRGGKSAQAKRKRKRLAAEARQAELAANAVPPTPIELVSDPADAELEDAADPAAAASSASPSSAAAAAIDGAADPSSAAVADNDSQVAPSTKKKKKNKPGLAQRTKLHAAMELAKAAALAQTEVKYYAQRYSLFSLFDKGIRMDREGWFSVTPELIAQHQAERCRADTIIDAYAGVGGNAIAFAQTCRHVIAIEIDPLRLELARHNAAIYGVADRIEFVCGDYLALLPGLRADVVFLAPPWGGVDYNANAKHFDIENDICIERSSDSNSSKSNGEAEAATAADPASAPTASSSSSPRRSGGGFEIFQRTLAITSNIAYCLPRNILATQVQQMSLLPARARDGSVLPAAAQPAAAVACELEENRVGGKVKMMTAYFGQLVRPPLEYDAAAAAAAPVATFQADPNFSYSETMAPAY